MPVTFTGPYPTVFSGVATAMVISHATFSSGVTNTGTISPHGIAVISSTLLSGGIVDTGTVFGGISVDGHSRIVGTAAAPSMAGR